MDICHVKNAELEAKHQKSKVELYSEVVYAVFTSASQMTAAKVMDIIIQENSFLKGYDENDDNNMSDETKSETNYSINNKWNNTRNKHLTKHNTNDDVDFDNCVVHTVR